MDRKLKALFDYQKFNENKKIILHCLFKTFWAARRTRSSAEDKYSIFLKSKFSYVIPIKEVFSSASSCGEVVVSNLQDSITFSVLPI